MTVVKLLLVPLFCCSFICCLYLVPERALVEYVDTNYVHEGIMNVRRYNRNGGYVVNIAGTIMQTWGNNVTFHVYLYEFLHNEYKSTFIEFHFKICELLASDPYIGKTVMKTGAVRKCPLPPGHYELANMTLSVTDFPYLWPFEKARADGVIMHGKTTIANGSLYLLFKQSSKKN